MEKLTEQIPPDQEESELDIETQELQVEDLDFWTLSFVREHMDMPERIDFDPKEELEKIKKAVAESPENQQSNQRFFLMKSFKKRLKLLRENMAQAQLDLECFIRKNPKADKKELLLTVEEIANRNNVSAQASRLKGAVLRYFQAHTDIVDTVESYKTRHPDTWQTQLFEDLFDRSPNGQIEIEIMPMNIYIKIGNIEDYVIANGAPDNIARSSGGAMLTKEFPKVKLLSGKVLIENTSLTNPLDSKIRIKPHEEEHSIHKNIYPRSAFIKGERDWLRDIRSNQEIELPLFNAVIHGSITNILLGDWLYHAKTEVLAYMKNGKHIDGIEQLLTDPHGLYNFLDNRKEYYQDWFLGHLKNLKVKIRDSNNTRRGFPRGLPR